MGDYIEMVMADLTAVYLLFWKGQVVYVGQSINVFERIVTHRNKMNRRMAGKRMDGYATRGRKIIWFDKWRIIPCARSELSKRERELILLYNPIGNDKIKNVTRRNKGEVSIGDLIKSAGLEGATWVTGLSSGSALESLRPVYRRM
jgi:hypothetical protein